MRTGRAYSAPLYYEIAFGFVDPARQADLMLAFARRYADAPPRSFLDLGCGPGLQLRELARRGYRAVGLDRSARMLSYLRARAREDGTSIETVRGDFRSFALSPRADLAFILMGTIAYVRSNDEMLSHLRSVGRSVKRGGLFLIENMKLDWAAAAGSSMFNSQTWTAARDGIGVRSTYSVRLRDALTQTLSEELTLEVDDRGERSLLTERSVTKMVFPEEFKALVALEGSFEFVGWFERSSTRRLRKASFDNIALLRRH